MTVYKLLASGSPWGDYGAILVSGMIGYPAQENSLLHIERTGPFVPPISFPVAHVVVTDTFRARLTDSGLTGFSFRPVVKSRIVHLEWDKWDAEAEDPELYPGTGEPADYILERPHSQALADQMEPLWEMIFDSAAPVERTKTSFWEVDIRFIEASLPATDFFGAETVLSTYVNDRAKDWLQREAGRWVRFEEARFTTDSPAPIEWVPPKPVEEELRELVEQDKLISAILLIQRHTHCDLHEARSVIETVRSELE